MNSAKTPRGGAPETPEAETEPQPARRRRSPSDQAFLREAAQIVEEVIAASDETIDAYIEEHDLRHLITDERIDQAMTARTERALGARRGGPAHRRQRHEREGSRQAGTKPPGDDEGSQGAPVGTSRIMTGAAIVLTSVDTPIRARPHRRLLDG